MKWELPDLDLQNIGNWPPTYKKLALGLLFIAILGAGYWIDIHPQWQNLKEAHQKELELRQTFADKQAQAANLEDYQRQLKKIKQRLITLLRQLPSQTEIEDLLVDISQAGLASGLKFELFHPKDQSPKEFYAELPIKIRVTGGFHQFGKFISRAASLPRIVTLHDIDVHPSNNSDKLNIRLIAKIYRYIETEKDSKLTNS